MNTLIANVTTSFLWFALTFWVYLETRSVLATAFIGGSYMVLIAILSLLFGMIVDHNKKNRFMLVSSVITLVAYLLAGIVSLSIALIFLLTGFVGLIVTLLAFRTKSYRYLSKSYKKA